MASESLFLASEFLEIILGSHRRCLEVLGKQRNFLERFGGFQNEFQKQKAQLSI